MATTKSSAQPTVCSRRIFATSVVTIRFTATGGVNWPMAMFIASRMPNHTGFHSKCCITGIRIGIRIR